MCHTRFMRLLDPPEGEYERDCVMYLRKSKGKAGIAKQMRKNLAHADRCRWRVVAVFTDEDLTAFRHILDKTPSKRLDYLAMVEFIRADTRQTPLGVLAMHADRIHREVTEAKAFAQLCAENNHPVETATSGRYDLTTATGRKRFLVDAIDAEYEVDHQSERRVSDKQDAVLLGRWLGGPVPFGYKAVRIEDDEPRVLILKEPEAGLLRDAYMAVIRAGSAEVLPEIARSWNKAGLRRRQKNSLWTGSAIARTMRLARNAGLMESRGVIVQTSRPDGKAEWPAIVSEDLWRAAEFILRPRVGSKKGPKAKYFGSRLFTCGGLATSGEGECGNTLIGTASVYQARKGDAHPPPTKVYRCRARGPGHVMRNAEHLDDYVAKVLKARLSRPDFREALARLEPVDVSDLRARVKLEEQALEEWEAEARRGTSPRLVAAGAEAAQRRLDALKDQIAASAASPLLTEIVEAEDFAQLWDSKADDLNWRRAVLALFVTVVVLPARPGRPVGSGQDRYFDTEAVRFDWKPLGAPVKQG